MALLLKGAHLIDPSVNRDEIADIAIRDGVIAEVGTNLSIPKGETLDMTGRVIIPGLVDMHAHLRDPGYEYKEDICSGQKAAAVGGFTGVAVMPNTFPVCDRGSTVAYILDKATGRGRTRVHVVGAISAGLKGESLAEMGDMARFGAVAFSDDGRGVQNNGMMRRAMDYAYGLGRTLLSHCQFEDITAGGVVNEGVASTRLGLAGWPAAGEEMQIARDIALCRLTGCSLHIQHLSTAAGVAMVRAAKSEGLPVSCEVTPHHLFLCEDDISVCYETNLKVNPPLRTREDMLALQDALVAGDIDCVATDHAPHAAHEKALEFELAPFGTTGLETALSLVLTKLVATGKLSLAQMVERMAHAPRRILGLSPIRLDVGSVADLTVLDTTLKWKVGEDGFASRSQNSAFLGWELLGKATDVFVAGYASLQDGSVIKW